MNGMKGLTRVVTRYTFRGRMVVLILSLSLLLLPFSLILIPPILTALTTWTLLLLMLTASLRYWSRHVLWAWGLLVMVRVVLVRVTRMVVVDRNIHRLTLVLWVLRVSLLMMVLLLLDRDVVVRVRSHTWGRSMLGMTSLRRVREGISWNRRTRTGTRLNPLRRSCLSPSRSTTTVKGCSDRRSTLT